MTDEAKKKPKTLGDLAATFLDSALTAMEEALADNAERVAATEAKAKAAASAKEPRAANVRVLQIRRLESNGRGYVLAADVKKYLEHPATTKQGLIDLLASE